MQTKFAKFLPVLKIWLIVLGSILILAIATGGFWPAEQAESRELAVGTATLKPGRSFSTRIPITPNFTLTAHPMPTATMLPTYTPLPAVPSAQRTGLWAENLSFGPPLPFGKGSKNRFDQVSWSPDGARLAFDLVEENKLQEAARNKLIVTSIGITDKAGQVVTPLATGFSPIWSPDGNHIAYVAYIDTMDVLHVRIVNVQSKQVTEVAGFGKGGQFPILAWLSPWELAVCTEDLQVFDLRTGQTHALVNAGILAQAQLSVALRYITALPAKRLFALASTDEILLLEWTNGSARLIRRVPEGLMDWLAISPDGQLLAYVTPDQDLLKIIGIRSEPPRIEVDSRRASSLSWSPDSASLIFLDEEGGEIVNRDGSGSSPIETMPSGQRREPGFSSLAWSPDGSQIIAVDGNEQLRLVAVTRK